jgi:predicted DNA-binding transcriptional regulator YafY
MSKSIIDRLERLDYLIRIKATGTPTELSRKLNLSERCTYNYIDLLKQLGAPISYCRKRNSYYYEEHGRFHFNFFRDPAASSGIT